MPKYYIRQNNNSLLNIEIDSHSLSSDEYGAIYKINSPFLFRKRVFKKLNDENQTEAVCAQIQDMIDNPPQHISESDFKICWPIDIVYDESDNFIGYVMPQASDKSIDLEHFLKGDAKDLPQEFEKFFDTVDKHTLRYQVCTNLFEALKSVAHYPLVDISTSNVYIDNDAKVYLVNCESMFVVPTDIETVKFRQSLVKDNSVTKGKNKQQVAQISNNFWGKVSLAILSYQILFDIHPFEAKFVPPYDSLTEPDQRIISNLFVHGYGSKYLEYLPSAHKVFYKLHPRIQALFRDALEIKVSRYKPTIEDWNSNFHTFLENEQHGLAPIKEKTSTENIPVSTVWPPKATTNTVTSEPTITPVSFFDNVDLTQANIAKEKITKKNKTSNAWIYLLSLFAVVILVMVFISPSEENSDIKPITTVNDFIASKETGDSAASDEGMVSNDFISPTEQLASEGDYKGCLYVVTDQANMRSRASIDSAVVSTWGYNTKLCTTDTPQVRSNGMVWFNVEGDGISGWMASSVLSKFPRTMYYSKCNEHANELEFSVDALGANVRSRPSQDDDAVIGVIQKDEVVCAYQYAFSGDASIGRWLGFTLSNGETGWVAENLLEPLY